jgi:hypothetical protein
LRLTDSCGHATDPSPLGSVRWGRRIGGGGWRCTCSASAIVNVALPTIQEDLGFSQNDLAWVVNAYLVAFGGLLLLSVLGCTADEALALLSLW